MSPTSQSFLFMGSPPDSNWRSSLNAKKKNKCLIIRFFLTFHILSLQIIPMKKVDRLKLICKRVVKKLNVYNPYIKYFSSLLTDRERGNWPMRLATASSTDTPRSTDPPRSAGPGLFSLAFRGVSKGAVKCLVKSDKNRREKKNYSIQIKLC